MDNKTDPDKIDNRLAILQKQYEELLKKQVKIQESMSKLKVLKEGLNDSPTN